MTDAAKTEALREDSRNEDRGPVLLGLAREAIASAFGPASRADQTAAWLRVKGACFVTLRQEGELRGCIGSIEAYRPLQDDVTANARASAFRDPRFRPLAVGELERTRIEISLLSAREFLHVRSEADALAKIRPHIDGLTLEWGRHRGTFLPQVWEALPDPRDFLAQLKLKAGLPSNFWSDEIRLGRYYVSKWSEPETGPEA